MGLVRRILGKFYTRKSMGTQGPSQEPKRDGMTPREPSQEAQRKATTTKESKSGSDRIGTTSPSQTSEPIRTEDQVQAICDQAQKLYKEGKFAQAVELFDRLMHAPPHLINKLFLRQYRAMACCEAGRFEEAKQEFADLLRVVGEHVPPVRNHGPLTFWYLKAHYKGDEDKAMSALMKLP